jgi:glycogen debranching enzyme
VDQQSLEQRSRGLPVHPDVSGRLAPGDRIVGYRSLASAFRAPPLSTARALLRLAKVDRLDKLGAAGLPLAATTSDPGVDVDPELRKFEAVFARDALRVSDFIGRFFPRLQWATVHGLAQIQGLQYDNVREEEPGKIFHEWRDSTDPIAKKLTAQSGWEWPYYGAVDTTPLYIRAVAVLLKNNPNAAAVEIKRRDGRHWTLADSVDSAIAWLCQRVDEDPDGLLTYRRFNPGGIENQIWRDSWDSLSHADGSLPNHEQPIAALDAQVLAYDALVAGASYLRVRSSDDARAAGELEERASRVRRTLLDRFWVESGPTSFFAAALDFSTTGERRSLLIRVSDMGHLLASRLLCGSVIRGYRDAVVRQLFSPGLLCSAGIRSLHKDEVRYWPGGYHTGGSWLWQSMHIADGLEQHGFAHLATELRSRCGQIYLQTGLLPEFARGDDDRNILNDRVIDLWQAADQRKNRLEQPPQEVQAWTVASLYAAKRLARARTHPLPSPTPLEQEIYKELSERTERLSSSKTS